MEVAYISIPALSVAFLPVAVVVAIFYAWSARTDGNTAIYGLLRMLLQLLLVGYLLNYIFDTDSSVVVAGVLSFMLVAASWIALRTVPLQRRSLLLPSLVAIGVSSLTVLALITQGVLQVEPWYNPRYMLPLGGMVFAGSMNAVSLAAERYYSELSSGTEAKSARLHAFQASLIPVTNSMFAVGLVSLPGMMTGQILSGISPLIAARYQIVVMCMLFGAAGISAAAFLVLNRAKPLTDEHS